jgi:hypothetical protein
MFKKTVFALSLLISAPMFANEPIYLLSKENVSKVVTATRKYAKQAKEAAQTAGKKVAEKASTVSESVKRNASVAKEYAVQAKYTIIQSSNSAINFTKQGANYATDKALAAKEYVLSGAAAAYVNARIQSSQEWAKAHPYKTAGITAAIIATPYVLKKAYQGTKRSLNWLKDLAKGPFTINGTTYYGSF